MSARGIPGQLRALTDRVESVETSQETCQQIIDDKVLPVLADTVEAQRDLTRKLDALSKEVESLRRVPK